MSRLLHIPFNTIGGVISTPTDMSGNARSVQNVGVLLSGAYSKYGGRSGLFSDGGEGNQYLYLSDATPYAFTGPFTIQCWLYPRAFSAGWGGFIMNTRNSSATGGTGFCFTYGYSGYSGQLAWEYGSTVVRSQTAPVLNTWNHVAAYRDASNAIYVALNGVPTSSPVTLSGTLTSTLVYIGRSGNSTNGVGVNGYIDDFEVRDDCLYSSASFTPPDAIPYTDLTVTLSRRRSKEIGAAAKPGASFTVKNAEHRYAASNWKITGTVEEYAESGNLMLSRRVRLHDQDTGRLVAETWSGADGTYTFSRLAKGRLYYAVAFDYTGQYPAGVIAQNLTPE